MNGPDHYREAENMLALAGDSGELMTNVGVPSAASDLIAAALVHATLALTAATAGHRTTWADESTNTAATYVEGEWAEVLR